MEVLLLVFVVLTLYFPPTRSTVNFPENTTTHNKINVSYLRQDGSVTLSKNCTVKPVSDMVRHDIKEILDAGTKLIIFELNFRNQQ